MIDGNERAVFDEAAALGGDGDVGLAARLCGRARVDGDDRGGGLVRDKAREQREVVVAAAG